MVAILASSQNWKKKRKKTLPWTDPIVSTPYELLLWMVAILASSQKKKKKEKNSAMDQPHHLHPIGTTRSP
jgi:hypothetical protein